MLNLQTRRTVCNKYQNRDFSTRIPSPQNSKPGIQIPRTSQCSKQILYYGKNDALPVIKSEHTLCV